jgi:Caudovirus prohead serine protease
VSLSFGYLATDKEMRTDGVQEPRELDLFEISLVPTPANADTRILSYKSASPDEPERPPRRAPTAEQQRVRAEWRALPTAPLSSDPEVALEREEKRQARELRRQCDRIRLAESLGWDDDLIKRLGI